MIKAVERLQEYVNLLLEPQNLEILKAAYGDVIVTKSVAEPIENGKADRVTVECDGHSFN